MNNPTDAFYFTGWYTLMAVQRCDIITPIGESIKYITPVPYLHVSPYKTRSLHGAVYIYYTVFSYMSIKSTFSYGYTDTVYSFYKVTSNVFIPIS